MCFAGHHIFVVINFVDKPFKIWMKYYGCILFLATNTKLHSSYNYFVATTYMIVSLVTLNEVCLL